MPKATVKTRSWNWNNRSQPYQPSNESKPVAFMCGLHGGVKYGLAGAFPNVLEHFTNENRVKLDFGPVPSIKSPMQRPFAHPVEKNGITPISPLDYFTTVPHNMTVVDFSLADNTITSNWKIESYLLNLLQIDTSYIKDFIKELKEGTSLPLQNSTTDPDIQDVTYQTQLLLNFATIYNPKEDIPNTLLGVEKHEAIYNARIIDGKITVSPAGHGEEYKSISGTSKKLPPTKLPPTIKTQYNGKTDDLFDEMLKDDDYGPHEKKPYTAKKHILLSHYFLYLNEIYGNRPIIIYLLNCKPLTMMTPQQNFFEETQQNFVGEALGKKTEPKWINYFNLYANSRYVQSETLTYKYLIDCENICKNSIQVLEIMQEFYLKNTEKFRKTKRALDKLLYDNEQLLARYRNIDLKGQTPFDERKKSIQFFREKLKEIGEKKDDIKKNISNIDSYVSGNATQNEISNWLRYIKNRVSDVKSFVDVKSFFGYGGKKKSKRKNRKSLKKRRKTKKNKSKQ